MKNKIFSLILVLCFIFMGSLLLCACTNPFNLKNNGGGMQKASFDSYTQQITITEN